MLARSQCPLLCIFCIVSLDVTLNSGNGTFVNSILYKLFTADLCPFVHHCDHNITSFLIINSRHSRSYNMNDTKDYFTLLLAFTPEKDFLMLLASILL